MNTQEYRREVQSVIRASYLKRLADYLDLVDQSTNPEDHRKAVELLAKLSDAFPATDEGKSLTTVQINIGGAAPISVAANGGMVQPVGTLKKIDAELLDPPDEFRPTQAMTEAALLLNLDLQPVLMEKL